MDDDEQPVVQHNTKMGFDVLVNRTLAGIKKKMEERLTDNEDDAMK